MEADRDATVAPGNPLHREAGFAYAILRTVSVHRHADRRFYHGSDRPIESRQP